MPSSSDNLRCWFDSLSILQKILENGLLTGPSAPTFVKGGIGVRRFVQNPNSVGSLTKFPDAAAQLATWSTRTYKELSMDSRIKPASCDPIYKIAQGAPTPPIFGGLLRTMFQNLKNALLTEKINPSLALAIEQSFATFLTNEFFRKVGIR